MKFKEIGVPQLVETVVSCYEKLKSKLGKICDVESYFGIIALKDGLIQSVSLNELGECDSYIPFCVQCAYVYKNARYSIFYGMNNCSIINMFGRVHNDEHGACKNGNILYTSVFKPKMMNFNLVEGFRDFTSADQKIYSYDHIFNVMNIDEFRLIDAHNIIEPEHILHVFERIEDFAELYYIQIMEAMQDDEFISKLELEQREENWLLPQRKKISSSIKLNIALNSFCNGDYRAASKKFHSLKDILTRYETRRLHSIDSALKEGKPPPVENNIFNYVKKNKIAVRNEIKYTIYSILIAFPVTFLTSLSAFLFAKNTYFDSFAQGRPLLILEPETPFYIILALLMGMILLLPGTQIAMRIFFKDWHDKQNIQIGTYKNKSELWPDGALGYFAKGLIALIIFGFALLINNNMVFYRDRMVMSDGNFRGISEQVIDYSEISNIYKVTRMRIGDRISDGWRIYYLYLENRDMIIRVENIFASKREFIERGLPIIVNATNKEPVEVGFFEEIFYHILLVNGDG